MPVLGITADDYALPFTGWLPTQLPGIAGWWDPSNLGSITEVSGGVSQLNDLSANGRHLVQTNGSYRPITGTHTINGLNVLKYGAKVLIPPNPLEIPQPCTYAAIVSHDGATGNQRVLGSSGNTLYISTTAGTSGRTAYAAPTNVAGTSANEVSAGPHIFIAIFDSAGAGSSMRMDGIVQLTGNPGVNGFDTMFIGANAATGGTGWRETIGEIVMCSTALAGTDLAELETYLSDKWGIPLP